MNTGFIDSVTSFSVLHILLVLILWFLNSQAGNSQVWHFEEVLLWILDLASLCLPLIDCINIVWCIMLCDVKGKLGNILCKSYKLDCFMFIDICGQIEHDWYVDPSANSCVVFPDASVPKYCNPSYSTEQWRWSKGWQTWSAPGIHPGMSAIREA